MLSVEDFCGEIAAMNNMQINIIDMDPNIKDIIPIFYGHERCAPSHSYGPHVRDHYLIHICLSGCGVIRDKRGEHKVKSGEFFLIREGEVTTYTADALDPWEYMWIAFKGSAAGTFAADKTVYSCPEALSNRIRDSILNTEGNGYYYISYIYELMAISSSEGIPMRDVASKIKRYIKYNYMDDITVDGLSRLFGFERSYIYRVFMKKYGVGVKEYIISTRMEHAKELLLCGQSVAATAFMVGYSDEFNFSRSYKKYYGISPSQTTRDGEK